MQGTISRRLWAKAGAERIPLTGAFELLPICNFACKMCYVRKSRAEVEKAGGLMDGKRWLEIAEDAAKCGLLFPLLTGGEPFLYEDFQEVFAGMQDLGMQVSINSNASRIDQNMARWLGRHTPTRINITLYGASEETYQKLCGNGESFLKVKNAVRWLKQYGVPIKLNASITPQNVQDLESMISYAKECQIPIQAATYMFPPIRRNAAMVGQNERLSPEEAALARVKTDFLTGDVDWFWRQAERFGRFQKGEERFRENADEEKRCEDKKMTDDHALPGRTLFFLGGLAGQSGQLRHVRFGKNIFKRAFFCRSLERTGCTDRKSMLFSGVYTLCKQKNLSSLHCDDRCRMWRRKRMSGISLPDACGRGRSLSGCA